MPSFSTRNGLSIGRAAPTVNPLPPLTRFNPPISTQRIDTSLSHLQTTKYLWYPKEELKYYVEFGISTYNRTNLDRVGVLNPHHRIRLPLPLQMLDNHHVSFVMSPLMAFGAGAALLGTAATKNTPQASQPVISRDPKTGAPIEQAQAFNDAVSATGKYIAGKAPLGIGPAFQAFTGYSPNEFMTILLAGPQYKRNEFVWKFSPNSPDESRAINKIIRLFNNSMAPGIAAYILFTFPQVFTISFIPNSQYMFKMKPCILENMIVNYSAGGRNSFLRADSDTDNINAPESLEVRMRFLELEFWLHGDFIEDNRPDSVSGPSVG